MKTYIQVNLMHAFDVQEVKNGKAEDDLNNNIKY